MPETSLEDMRIEESGEIDELLSKLYMLANRIVQFHGRHVKGLLLIHGILDHEDALDQMFAAAKEISSLFQLIEEDSSIVLGTAKAIKERLVSSQNLMSDRELLPEQRSAFDGVLKLAPKINTINEGISFCLCTIQEIQAKSRQKDRIVYESAVHEDLQELSETLSTISETVQEVISTLSSLSHMNHTYSQEDLRNKVAADIQLEQKDVEHLLHIFSSSRKQLTAAMQGWWTDESKKGRLKNVLSKRVLPMLQNALRYDEGIRKAVAEISQMDLGLAREQNIDLERKQRELSALAGSIRGVFVKLNTNTVPGLLRMLDKDEPDRQYVTSVLKTMVEIFGRLHMKIIHMQELLMIKGAINTRDMEFRLGMND